MEIILENISKKYASGWVIKNLSTKITSGQKISITGLNGSGKSTLIQIISGYLSPSKGKITYNYLGNQISRNDIYKHLSIVAAYSELDEELSAQELFEHYNKFKPFLISEVKRFLEIVDLEKEKNKSIKDYSSGMKQRLNLGLGVLMDTPLLILDEPSSFLDNNKKQWFNDLLKDYGQQKTIVVASNDPGDYDYCDAQINLEFQTR